MCHQLGVLYLTGIAQFAVHARQRVERQALAQVAAHKLFAAHRQAELAAAHSVLLERLDLIHIVLS